MTNSASRRKCIICFSDKINPIIELKNMPVFMGANKGFKEEFSNMTFQECKECKNVQIKEIIDPKLLYINNHNIDTVGKTWINHNKQFVKFIKKDVINKTILEIGDPSYKISEKISKKSKEWNIVELNPNLNLKKPENVNLITEYFDENFQIDKKIDIIIHSHCFEHMPNPIEHLNFVYNILKENGKLIFSIPNLHEILKTGGSPNSALHFEHTFFYNKKFMQDILQKCGFKVLEIKEFSNHSLFFKCIKDKKKTKKIKHKTKAAKLFIKNNQKHLTNVKKINNKIKDKTNIYLYGCHVSSQFILNAGLNQSNITNLLDNSISKTGFPLYGTNIITQKPDIIKTTNDPIVISSHMGIYKTEINKQLKKINKNVTLL